MAKANLWAHRERHWEGTARGPPEVRDTLQNTAYADLFKGNAENLESTVFLKNIFLGWTKEIHQIPPSCEPLGAVYLWLFSTFLLDYLCIR